MKIILDIQKCIGCGLCASLCPDFWEMNDNDNKAHLKGQKSETKEEIELTEPKCAQEATESCPVQAIEIK
ncbi:MAG: hypothetical protein A3D38_00350 [Candidatus Portnoybacteria bacterium RIFCSPHIGHO2_02_FULL_40_23]|uniref:Ferredoxin n=1 Tax=Candidatus Portnoybacteria bacterium RIFCSPLOWO2_02_FULL_40_15 TaxID=1802002 RepID=A0A1G2FSH2_9BACT|nr:MAG: hypothetical protein A3D38_00350 [Candidatus Portnoybacteria bacterium RIFCSPHIGHO2_02_FULL_40_23]OGZ41026.1 MAG: hypothetical protein A3I20_01015 [Candidatus Portnoybacteria bacterium RIFCSPLOWO2_02_FULL_40_15]